MNPRPTVDPPRRLRATDLAQAAGISVQQVRNYIDLGVLPPVERTASGYRIFTDDHAAALTVARQLAEGHGWARTRDIMRAAHAGDLEAVLAALDASHAEPASRDRAAQRRSLLRLRASAALYAYLQRLKLDVL
ncbi:MerR family DNA-binding transcriptional regulator [Planosporangium flavigriseum]|nr:MerR family DNA-binding transcriptional regulator [Planosporangium flavigriseum]